VKAVDYLSGLTQARLKELLEYDPLTGLRVPAQQRQELVQLARDTGLSVPGLVRLATQRLLEDRKSLLRGVKFWVPDRGWGFIIDANGKDVFFCGTELVSKTYLPQKDDRVLYQPGMSRGRPCAVNVTEAA
jgi:cold shock CspA family protein